MSADEQDHRAVNWQFGSHRMDKETCMTASNPPYVVPRWPIRVNYPPRSAIEPTIHAAMPLEA